MNDILVAMSDFFAGLEPREKLILKMASVFFALALVVMLVLPKWEAYSQLKEQRDALQADMYWLQEQQALVGKLVNSCPTMREHQGDQKSDLTSLAGRNQLTVKTTVQRDKVISLSVAGEKSNQFLQLMYQIACRGYVLSDVSLQIDKTDTSLLNATIEVQRVD